MRFRKSKAELEEELKIKLMSREGVQIRRGKVMVIKERCKGCGYCIENCPKGILQFSEDINKKGYHYPVVKEEPPFKVCINCGFCTAICPDMAIFSVPIEEGS